MKSHSVAFAAVLLLAAVAAAQEAPTAPAEDDQAQARVVTLQAYEEAQKLLEKGDLDGAVNALTSAADKSGDSPEANQLRMLAVYWLAGRFLGDGTGAEAAEKLMAEVLRKTTDRDVDRINVTIANIYAVMGNYEAAGKTAQAYLEKFPAPSEDELQQLREELISAGVPAEPDPAQQHPRLLARSVAQELLERLALIGMPAPHFELEALDGQNVSPRRYEGKVLLLHVWASSSRECRAELPTVKKVYKRYGAQGFDILSLSYDKDKDKLAAFVRDQKMPWKHVYLGEAAKQLEELYRYDGIPAMFLVDRRGVLRARDLTGAALRRQVARLMAEEPAE